MEIREKVEIEKVTGYKCDICEQSCTKGDCGPEFATLQAHWGYDSNKDCQEHECHMCEECYDKVRDFIKSLGGNVRTYEYHIVSGDRLGEWPK